MTHIRECFSSEIKCPVQDRYLLGHKLNTFLQQPKRECLFESKKEATHVDMSASFLRCPKRVKITYRAVNLWAWCCGFEQLPRYIPKM